MRSETWQEFKKIIKKLLEAAGPFQQDRRHFFVSDSKMILKWELS
jgi:hypothetical protein